MKRRMLTAKITAALLSGMLITTNISPTLVAHAEAVVNSQEEGLLNEDSVNDYKTIGGVTDYKQDGNKVTFDLATGEKLRVSFLENGVFRIYMDPTGEFQEVPTPNSEEHITEIIVKDEASYDRTVPTVADGENIVLSTDQIELKVEKETARMELVNKTTGETIWKEAEPLKYKDEETIQTLVAEDDEYFYGGGMQNGRFSHRGKTINIKNENNWIDGGVASPTPFYFSTSGYGVMRHTFQQGEYAFSSKEPGKVITKHQESRFDAYYFVDDKPANIINKFTDLTGKAVLLPEYGFYLGHANCYSRDWIDDETGKESQTQKPGFDRQETLMTDGIKVVDAHVDNDMPLGWFLPNDGYGCGYGRANDLDENIANLKQFVDYARERGIQTGLWTQSTLKPTGNQEVYLERDIEKEVGVAGTNAVKTDVAWVGDGYSFALNSVRQAAEGIINNSKDNARPFIISLDGWAGTQRYTSIWSGDQTGGQWEYIRFHIPTYIGSGLSGQPNVGSDMDGIFGGGSLVQTRDFQWKTFTPVQIDMDGWGSNAKNPYVFNDPYTSINRMYLKLKSSMMSYNYSIANEATNTGVPMIRAMMLDYPNAYTYGTATQYQYMWGPNLLVAPIYQNTASDENGNDIRNDIYLPDEDQIWIDYFSGTQYRGGGVLNSFDAPLWKLPVFVKNGAIIPMNNPNNTPESIDHSKRIFEVYPSGDTEFEVYEDDGLTTDYLAGVSATSLITSSAPKTGKGTAVIKAGKVSGSYTGMVKDRETEFVVNVSEKPSSFVATVGGKDVKLTEAKSLEEYENGTNMYFYDEKPNLNKFATEGSEFEKVEITTTPKVYVKVEKTDVTKNEVELTVNDFINEQAINKNELNTNLSAPTNITAPADKITSDSIKLTWDEVEGATSYDVEFNGTIYNNLVKPEYDSFSLSFDTEYSYRVRSVNADGYSEWSEPIVVKTSLDPYRNVPSMDVIWTQGYYDGDSPDKAVDGDINTQFHSAGDAIDQPFVVDMKKAYPIEKFEFLFRSHANGSVRRGEIYSSIDGINYTKLFSNSEETGEPAWPIDGQVNTLEFKEPIMARYFKIVPKVSVSNLLAIREIRPFKVDGSKGIVVGDWDNSGDLGDGDLTFLQNYTGLSNVDSDWDYVSIADLNGNGLIDAYDISYVASKLKGGVVETEDTMAGELMLLPSKTELKAGEEFTVDIVGAGLSDVNALSAEIGIDTNKYEVISAPTPTLLTSGMTNLSKVRAHSDGTQDIYAVFTNVGEGDKLSGTDSVARITLKAKTDTTWDMELSHALIVDSKLNSKLAIAEVTDNDAPLPELGEGTVKVSNEAIKVTADESQLQDGMGLDKLTDGTTSSDDASRMDLKWVLSEDQEDKGSLPYEMTFNFDEPKELDNFTIYNRMNSDGTINVAALKEVKAVGYLGEEATDLGIISDIETATTVFELNGQKFDKIVVTALDSHKDKNTLAINEIEFYEKVGQEVTGIEFAEDTVGNIYLNKVTPIFAKVSPDNVMNSSYRISSDNEDVIKVIRLDNEGKPNYYLLGLKPGVANITATTANGSFEVKKSITVGEVDKSLLDKAIKEAEGYANSGEKYTEDSYQALVGTIEAAKEVLNNGDATEEQVVSAISALNKAIDNLKKVDEENVVVDKSKLLAAIDEAKAIKEADYTSDSYRRLQARLDEAISVNAKENATQNEVDEATDELRTAIDRLEKVNDDNNNGNNGQDQEVNKYFLNGLVNNALNLDSKKYTTESWEKVQDLLKTAQEVMAKEDATQEEVNKIYNELNLAIQGLKEVSDEAGSGSNKPSTTVKPNDGKGNGLPNTGGTPAGLVGLIGTITAALGFGMYKKKKK